MKTFRFFITATFILAMAISNLSAQWQTLNTSNISNWPANQTEDAKMAIISNSQNGAGIGLLEPGFQSNPTLYFDANGVWGGLKYGLSRGNINLSVSPGSATGTKRPILMRSFYGLGLKTNRGKVSLGQNGIFTIGLDETRIQNIAKEPHTHKYKLYVKGGVRTEEVKVDLAGNWPDYVFANDYELVSLDKVAEFIDTEKHLPGIPRAAEFEKNGVELGEISRLQQEKIEELYLHIIALKKELDALKNQLK